MAEAWFRHLAKGEIDVVSVGSNPAGYVHPVAIEVMEEEGIDLSSHESKSWSAFLENEFDYIITVCDDAFETCPIFPGSGVRIHWPFEDPAKFVGTETEVKVAFRTTRDMIRQRVTELLGKNQY